MPFPHWCVWFSAEGNLISSRPYQGPRIQTHRSLSLTITPVHPDMQRVLIHASRSREERQVPNSRASGRYGGVRSSRRNSPAESPTFSGRRLWTMGPVGLSPAVCLRFPRAGVRPWFVRVAFSFQGTAFESVSVTAAHRSRPPCPLPCVRSVPVASVSRLPGASASRASHRVELCGAPRAASRRRCVVATWRTLPQHGCHCISERVKSRRSGTQTCRSERWATRRQNLCDAGHIGL